MQQHSKCRVLAPRFPGISADSRGSRPPRVERHQSLENLLVCQARWKPIRHEHRFIQLLVRQIQPPWPLVAQRRERLDLQLGFCCALSAEPAVALRDPLARSCADRLNPRIVCRFLASVLLHSSTVALAISVSTGRSTRLSCRPVSLSSLTAPATDRRCPSNQFDDGTGLAAQGLRRQYFLLCMYWVASGSSVNSRRFPTLSARATRTCSGVAKKNSRRSFTMFTRDEANAR